MAKYLLQVKNLFLLFIVNYIVLESTLLFNRQSLSLLFLNLSFLIYYYIFMFCLKFTLLFFVSWSLASVSLQFLLCLASVSTLPRFSLYSASLQSLLCLASVSTLPHFSLFSASLQSLLCLASVSTLSCFSLYSASCFSSCLTSNLM